MEEILHAYPSANVGLFQRYHLGGCASCGYHPVDTLAAVCQTNNIMDSMDDVITCIRGSGGEATFWWARAWLTSREETEIVFSVAICHAVGIDPDFLWKGLLVWSPKKRGEETQR